MNPAALIPTPDALQVPWGWFQFLLFLTLFLHLILMNVMLGTAVIAFVNLFRSSGETVPVAREISGKLPFAIAFTVNFGIAPLLFVQVLYGHFFYTSSVLMANFWLLVIFLLIAGYYMAYIFDYRYDSLLTGRILTVGCTVAMLLAIAFLMVNNFTLMERPEAWSRYFDQPDGMLLNLGDPTLFPRYFHFVTAAIAVGGLSLALYYTWKRPADGKTNADLIRSGCNWFGYATIINFGFGFWFFGSLPKAVFNFSVFPGNLIAPLLGVVLVLGTLAVIFSFQTRVMPMLFTVLPLVFVMILVRNLVRVAYLKPYFNLSDLKVVPQYSPLLLFLLLFVLGLALIGWMLLTAWKTFANKEVQS